MDGAAGWAEARSFGAGSLPWGCLMSIYDPAEAPASTSGRPPRAPICRPLESQGSASSSACADAAPYAIYSSLLWRAAGLQPRIAHVSKHIYFPGIDGVPVTEPAPVQSPSPPLRRTRARNNLGNGSNGGSSASYGSGRAAAVAAAGKQYAARQAARAAAAAAASSLEQPCFSGGAHSNSSSGTGCKSRHEMSPASDEPEYDSWQPFELTASMKRKRSKRPRVGCTAHRCVGLLGDIGIHVSHAAAASAVAASRSPSPSLLPSPAAVKAEPLQQQAQPSSAFLADVASAPILNMSRREDMSAVACGVYNAAPAFKVFASAGAGAATACADADADPSADVMSDDTHHHVSCSDGSASADTQMFLDGRKPHTTAFIYHSTGGQEEQQGRQMPGGCSRSLPASPESPSSPVSQLGSAMVA